MKRVLMLFLTVLFICLTIWCVLWIFSSASLASQFCQSDFSLFHTEFRCRQPYLGLIGGVVSILVAGLCAWLALRGKKNTGIKG